MNINFFETPCKELCRNETLFGLCDDQDGMKAYSSVEENEKWIATVKNDNAIKVSFTAIDNCIRILKKDTNDKESTCDGMLTFSDSLYLIELKKERTGWLPKAKEQLENTISLLNIAHDLNEFRFKKAFACNKKHPNFHVIESSEKKLFFERTGFRLDVQADIVIK